LASADFGVVNVQFRVFFSGNSIASPSISIHCLEKNPPARSVKSLPPIFTKSDPQHQGRRLPKPPQPWFVVFQFIDEHPNILQYQVIEHFKTHREGALIFTQSTLSRKLEQRTELKVRRTAKLQTQTLCHRSGFES